ncbi:MAG: cytochrome c [Gemmatimonadaceae bacterium]
MLLVPAILSLTACEWFTDFKRQPMVTVWEQDSILKHVRGAPQGSVPRSGTMVSEMQVSYLAGPGQVDSIGKMVTNPTPISEASLANGHMYYELNCAVCHGEKGIGDGPAVKYGMVGINIVTELSANRTDGYIYGMMRNGRGLMPTYNRIEEMDRWDVVNYVRALQGKAGGVAFATGRLAMPGVTGDKVPGASRIGPNRWTRPVLPSMIGTPGSGGMQSSERPNAQPAEGAALPVKTGEHE